MSDIPDMVHTGREELCGELADVILPKGSTVATNIEIRWYDLWRQTDLQLTRAAVRCLVRQVPCPVCGKVMEYRSRTEGGGMGLTFLYDLKCEECSLSVDLPSDYDIVGSSEVLYRYMHRYMDRVARPTGLMYPLCVTNEGRGVIHAWYGVRDPETGKVYKPEEYPGEYLWEDDSEEWRCNPKK